jgi:hypothetical protein
MQNATELLPSPLTNDQIKLSRGQNADILDAASLHEDCTLRYFNYKIPEGSKINQKIFDYFGINSSFGVQVLGKRQIPLPQSPINVQCVFFLFF